MSVVAAAIVTSAVVGGVTSYKSGKDAQEASERGTERAIDTQLQQTQLQLEEIRRQYDYQQEILLPQVQQQMNAQRAYSDLLGIGGPSAMQPGVQPGADYIPGPRSQAAQQGANQQEIDTLTEYMNRPGTSAADRAQYQAAIDEVNARPTDEARMAAEDRARGPGMARMGAPGSSGVRQDGAFVDPNLNPTRLADTATLPGVVEGNLLAGTSAEDDPYRNYIEGNRIAAPTADQDAMVQRTTDVTMTGARGGDQLQEGSAGTGVYGDVFQESPGYAFAREEMERQLDRQRSRGGPNIGGRAIMEAQRRAEGLANQDYYNWAGGRERDLLRRGEAEATDIGRMDQFASQDIGRGDQALAGYENQRISDIGRDDQGYQDYLRRREGDAARLDASAREVDALQGADLARQDQGYYNYLASVERAAGFGGGAAGQAVNASQRQAGNVSNAYGASGARISGLQADQGVSNANIAYQQGAGINNAIQGGAQNYMTYDYMRRNPVGVT